MMPDLGVPILGTPGNHGVSPSAINTLTKVGIVPGWVRRAYLVLPQPWAEQKCARPCLGLHKSEQGPGRALASPPGR